MQAMETQQLSYARQSPTQPRPAMYRLVITILLASGLLVVGLMASVAFFALMLEPGGWIFAVGMFLAAALLLYSGICSFTASVQYLRGRKEPDGNRERWIFPFRGSWM